MSTLRVEEILLLLPLKSILDQLLNQFIFAFKSNLNERIEAKHQQHLSCI